MRKRLDEHGIEFWGWAVAAAVHRDDGDSYDIWVRVFTVATFEQEEAERYAREQVEHDYPPSDGWKVIVSSMQIRGKTVEV